MYGLIASSTPFEKFNCLKAFRINNGLEVFDGPLMMEDLKNEMIRKSVYATVISTMGNKIVRDACHFGIIDHPQFRIIALIVTQLKYDLAEICDFEYQYDNMQCNYSNPSELKICQIIAPINSTLEKCDAVEFIDEVVEVMPVNLPLPQLPIIGFDRMVDSVNDGMDDEIDMTFVKKAQIGKEFTFIRLPLRRYYPMENMACSITDASCVVSFKGGRIKFREENVFEFNDCVSVEDYNTYYVIPTEERVVIRVRIKFSLYVHGRALRDEKMYLFANRFGNKCKKFFSFIVGKLKVLPMTRLVRRNISVFENCIMGIRMPNRHLLNQSLIMIGESWACSIGYNRVFETWCPYPRYEDWIPYVRDKFYTKYVIRSPANVFDAMKFDYIGFEFNTYLTDFDIWDKNRHNPPLRVSSYVDYLEYLKEFWITRSAVEEIFNNGLDTDVSSSENDRVFNSSILFSGYLESVEWEAVAIDDEDFRNFYGDDCYDPFDYERSVVENWQRYNYRQEEVSDSDDVDLGLIFDEVGLNRFVWNDVEEDLPELESQKEEDDDDEEWEFWEEEMQRRRDIL